MSVKLIILGLIILETHIVLLVLLYTFISVFLQRQKVGYSLALLIVTSIEYVIWQIFIEMKLELPDETWDGEMKTEIFELFLFQALITGVALVTTRFVYKRKKKHISRASIKEGMDTLPAGILFYWPGGLVKLVNAKMNKLAETVTGEKVFNGEDFWKKLCEKSIKGEEDYLEDTETDKNGEEKKEEEENAMVLLPDGTIYGFRKTVYDIYKHKIIEIVASDITEEMQLYDRLKEEQKKADSLNERLKELNSTIEVMTAEKEILQTKSMVHDEWGKTLIMSRRYLSVPDEELGKEIIKQWKLNAMLMKDEEDLDVTDDYTMVLKDIRNMGLEVRIKGVLPQEENLRYLVVLALRTCATNALRHGGGTMLSVISEIYDGFYDIRISNNGLVPEEPIEEGGGLTNLKRALQSAGGSLTQEYEDAFTVVVKIPKGEE